VDVVSFPLRPLYPRGKNLILLRQTNPVKPIKDKRFNTVLASEQGMLYRNCEKEERRRHNHNNKARKKRNRSVDTEQ
jgi:hypothetical protein